MQKINKAKLVLKYSKPASVFSPWESSLPIGNGKIGALIQGGVRYERIMISDARASWLGNVGVLPDVSDKLKEVRKAVEAKNQVIAGQIIEKGFETKKYTPTKSCPLPLADLVVEQEIFGKHINGYFRQVNMENGEASVCFNDSGTKIDRSCFVSCASDCLFYEINKEGTNSLNVSLSLVAHDYKYFAFDGVQAPLLSTDFDINNSFMIFDQEYNGFHYGVCARVVTDAKAVFQIIDGKLKIENADKIVVIAKTYFGKLKDKELGLIKNALLAFKQVSYEKSFKEHFVNYSKEWGKTELSISAEKETSIDNLISSFNENSTLLYEKLFHFSKYLICCGMSNDMLSPYLTGLWSFHYANDKALADCSCSLPAMYSSCIELGYEEKIKTLVNYFEKYSDDLKKNAYRIYKSKGYMVPNLIAVGTGLTASTLAKDISVVSAGAVIANIFYDYFLITKDLKFLKSTALPFMCEVANFYMNYFYENNRGESVCCPSFSPFGKSKYFEHKNIGVYTNCTSDLVTMRALIVNILSISNAYAIPLDCVVEYQNFLNNLPKLRTVKGSIAEYYDDDNSSLSAGFLHLYNVFGIRDVTANSNASSIAPYLNAVIQKIDKGLFAQTIVSLGRLAEISAILGQGDAAFNILRYMINNFLSKNLFFLNYDKNNLCAYVDGDNYFNMVGNSLFVNTFTSCFVLDYGHNIAILNAKPSAWKVGKIEGVYTKLNCIVDISWDDKKGLAYITFKAIKNTSFNCVLFKGVKKVKGYNIDVQNPFIENINLLNNKSLTLEIKY